jgi:hypothetical protein
MPIEKSNDFIANRTSDILDCSIVPQLGTDYILPCTLFASKPRQLSLFRNWLRAGGPRKYFAIPGSMERNHLCGLVSRLPGDRSRGPALIPGATRFSEK